MLVSLVPPTQLAKRDVPINLVYPDLYLQCARSWNDITYQKLCRNDNNNDVSWLKLLKRLHCDYVISP